MKKLYICLMIVLCSMKGFAQYSEYGGSYYDSQFGETGVRIIYGSPQPDWAAINAAQDAKARAQQEQMQQNIPKQTPTPPITTGGTTGGGSAPPKPSAPTPKPNIDPCALAKAQMANPDFKKMIGELDANRTLNHETGYSESKSGTFKPLRSSGYNTVKTYPWNPDFKGFFHVHVDPYKYWKNGKLEIFFPQQMFSPEDVGVFFTMLRTASENNNPTDQTYAGMVSTYGNFEMKFTGNIADINNANIKNINFGSDEIGEAYDKAFSRNETKEAALMDFIKNTLGVNGVSLLKLGKDGTSQLVVIGADGKATLINCN